MGRNARARKAAKEARIASELKEILMSRLRKRVAEQKALQARIMELHEEALAEEAGAKRAEKEMDRIIVKMNDGRAVEANRELK